MPGRRLGAYGASTRALGASGTRGHGAVRHAIRPTTLRAPTADDVPHVPGYSGSFMWKLLGARLAMGLRVPKLDF